jgi:hypothetical protein
LPGLAGDKRLVAVFPNRDGDALVLNPLDLLKIIEDELSEISDE